MRNRFFLFSTIALLLLGMVMIFTQHKTLAESTAVSVDVNWFEPVTLSTTTNDSITPVLQRNSSGDMIFVYSREIEGGTYAPYYRLLNNNSGAWVSEQTLYNNAEGNTLPDVAYANTNPNTAHAVWSYKKEYIVYADDSVWPSDPTIISENLTTAALTLDPAIAIDSNNNLHVVWTQDSKIYYASRINNSWSPPDEIGIDNFSHAVAIAIDDNNTVHVAWVGLITGKFQIRYRYKTTSDPLWSTVQTVSGDIRSESPFLLADGSRVYLSFTQFESIGTTIQKLHYVELSDNNPTLPVPIVDTVYTNGSDGTNNGTRSSMAVCGDTLHLYYYGNATPAGTGEEIWGLSRKNNTWDEVPTIITPLDDVIRSINPTVACDESSVYVVYEEIPNLGAPHTINYTYSDNRAFVYLPVILK